MMVINISEAEMVAAMFYRQWQRHDRKDIYRYYSARRRFDSMSVDFVYVCEEVNCNPDIDW